MFFWEDDICLCSDFERCPLHEKCRRAQHKVGIHTYSSFYNRDKKKECDYFLKKREGDE